MSPNGNSHGHTLITGANRGLGLAFVRHYLQAGKRVIATGRYLNSADELPKLQAERGEPIPW